MLADAGRLPSRRCGHLATFAIPICALRGETAVKSDARAASLRLPIPGMLERSQRAKVKAADRIEARSQLHQRLDGNPGLQPQSTQDRAHPRRLGQRRGRLPLELTGPRKPQRPLDRPLRVQVT
jgi:hypothetical protein